VPRELTTKQRAFIAAYQTGISATQAVIQAGYSKHSARHIAHTLMHDNKLVRAELDKVSHALAEAAEYNGERCMAELDEAIAFAVQTKQPNAYVKAIELRARLAGLLRDKVDVTVERIDINDALSAARARIDNLRHPCDPVAAIEGEFHELPSSTVRGSIDNKSTRLFGD
jgi:hypothetical protein